VTDARAVNLVARDAHALRTEQRRIYDVNGNVAAAAAAAHTTPGCEIQQS